MRSARCELFLVIHVFASEGLARLDESGLDLSASDGAQLIQTSVRHRTEDSVQFYLIKESVYPNDACSKGNRNMGKYDTIEQCAAAIRDAGETSFTYEVQGRHITTCWAETIDVDMTQWNSWMHALVTSTEPVCPGVGGGWIIEPNFNMYAWPPPTFTSPTEVDDAGPPPDMDGPGPSPDMDGPGPPPEDDRPAEPDVPTRPISATGDPHLVNVFGEHFDILQPGVYALLVIPRGAGVDDAKLRVEANAARLGDKCADIYFQMLNITGEWAEEEQKLSPVVFTATSGSTTDEPTWRSFGKVDLKVAWGRTGAGTDYLNFYVRHLSHVEYTIGGLLGEDDHTKAASPSQRCKKVVSLLDGSASADDAPGSVAEANWL